MRKSLLLAVPLMALVLVLLPYGEAFDPVTDTVTIDPLDFEGWPLLSGYEGSIDIKITSDRPVNLYILPLADLYEDWTAFDINEIQNNTPAEDTYEGVTSKDISKDYDYEDYYVVIAFNPSFEESATVTIEYEFWEEVLEEAIEDGICGSVILVGTISAVVIMALVIIVRRS